MIATADPFQVNVAISTLCHGEWEESATCGGLHQGNEIYFKASIEVGIQRDL